MNDKKIVENVSTVLLAIVDEVSRREALIRRSGNWCFFLRCKPELGVMQL